MNRRLNSSERAFAEADNSYTFSYAKEFISAVKANFPGEEYLILLAQKGHQDVGKILKRLSRFELDPQKFLDGDYDDPVALRIMAREAKMAGDLYERWKEQNKKRISIPDLSDEMKRAVGWPLDENLDE